MKHKHTLTMLNQLDYDAFVTQLGGIFEHAAWVAEQAWQQRPFWTIAELQQVMFDFVLASSKEDRLALIRNHPELAGREADAGTLTIDSKTEQARAGLDLCTADERKQLCDLNKRYREQFGFPFVIAVSGLNKHQIIAAMQARLLNDPETEFTTSIHEIGKIGGIRLHALLTE